MTYQKRIAQVRQCTQWDNRQNMRVTTDNWDLVTEDRYAYRLSNDVIEQARAMVGKVCILEFTGLACPVVSKITECPTGAEPLDTYCPPAEVVYPRRTV